MISHGFSAGRFRFRNSAFGPHSEPKPHPSARKKPLYSYLAVHAVQTEENINVITFFWMEITIQMVANDARISDQSEKSVDDLKEQR